MKNLLGLVFVWGSLSVFALESNLKEPIKVEVVRTEAGFKLHRGGEPYFVKGAGVQGISLKSLAERGGNSVRTWWIDGASQKLDDAHALGLTVSLCLPVVAERFDFDYSDQALVRELLIHVHEVVNRYKDHPALLTWIIGNELNLNMAEDSKVYQVVNQISQLVHTLDPNHPTTTTIVGGEKDIVDLIREQAPDLDFISIQTYGGIAAFPRYVKRSFQDSPVMITEWGPLGHWEVGQTQWQAPLEQTSTEKAERLLTTYKKNIEPQMSNLLGTYVFLWGQKQERTPTWFSLFTESGESTEAVDAMQYIWTGQWPSNRAPSIKSIRLANKKPRNNVVVYAGGVVEAEVQAEDLEGDPLRYWWSVKPESEEQHVGGDQEGYIEDVPKAVLNPFEQQVRIQVPTEVGAYRLFTTVFDNHGNAAHANIPFNVILRQP